MSNNIVPIIILPASSGRTIAAATSSTIPKIILYQRAGTIITLCNCADVTPESVPADALADIMFGGASCSSLLDGYDVTDTQ